MIDSLDICTYSFEHYDQHTYDIYNSQTKSKILIPNPGMFCSCSNQDFDLFQGQCTQLPQQQQQQQIPQQQQQQQQQHTFVKWTHSSRIMFELLFSNSGQ